MSYTMQTAGPETHIRVVELALVASIVVAWIAIVASG
jgi:hypothetical protein